MIKPRIVRKLIIQRAFKQAYWLVRVYYTRGRATLHGNFASYQTAAYWASGSIPGSITPSLEIK